MNEERIANSQKPKAKSQKLNSLPRNSYPVNFPNFPNFPNFL